MSFLKLDGVDLYYELHGEGPPVVFIHGASGTHLSWWQQIAELRHHFSCLIYDQRGYGKSRPTGPYNVGDGRLLYNDLRSLIGHVGFGAEKVSVVGASLGTAPALHYAMEHRDRIDRLVLVCGVGGTVTPLISVGWEQRYSRMKARQQGLPTGQPQLGGASRRGRVPPIRSAGEFERFAVAYHPYGPVGQTMHMDSPAITFLYAEIMAMAGGPPTVETLPCFKSRPVTAEEASTVQFPVLVVGGTEDPLFPPPELEEVGRLFPQGRTNLFKGAGHAAYYERANRFNDLVLDFLKHGHEA
jgi:pimeloyl-ACP methyl ester carboxylesterase